MTNQSTILSYYGVITEWTALPKERTPGAEFYDVALADFQNQMESLRDNGYSVTTLDRIRTGSQKNVVLTFDDGEVNNYDHVFPVLKAHGFLAYFFVVARRIGERGYMGWDELKEMHDAGMVIGSHGLSHEILTGLLDTQVEEELRASKRYLERNLGINIDTFSVPGGLCNDKVIRMAYDAGYRHVFISNRPRSLTLPCLSRITVRSGWKLERFQQALDGQVSLMAKGFDVFRGGARKVLGDRGYYWVRKMLLK